jgi:hypothetical protein
MCRTTLLMPQPSIETGMKSGATPLGRPAHRRCAMRVARIGLVSDRSALGGGLAVGLLGILAALAAPGCGHEEGSHYTSASKPPSVRVIHPEPRRIVRTIG